MPAALRRLEWVGAAVLLLVMAVTIIDVCGRYLFNMPLSGSVELTQFGIAIVVFTALPALTARRGHVRIDLFERAMPAWFIEASDRAYQALFAVCLATLAWRLGLIAQRTGKREIVTQYLHMPQAAIEWFMAALALVAALVALLAALRPGSYPLLREEDAEETA